MESPKIDVEKVLKEKSPKVYQFTPSIFLKKLKSIVIKKRSMRFLTN